MSAIDEFPDLSFSCPQLWAQMAGNEKTRFCDVCQKSVHNLSMMNAGARRALLASTGESPCVAYFKHVNGTPIDVTALAEGNPLKKRLTQAALLTLGAVGLGSIAVNSMALVEAITTDQEASTLGMGGNGQGDHHYIMITGVICSPSNAPSSGPPGLPPMFFKEPPELIGKWTPRTVTVPKKVTPSPQGK